MKTATLAALTLAVGLATYGAARANPTNFHPGTMPPAGDNSGAGNTTGSGTPTTSGNGLGGPGAVPEPATWALMLTGAAALGLALRRKRAKEA